MAGSYSCKYFNVSSRKETISHCQLRNNASHLNAHLKSLRLSDVQLCGKCGYFIEDTKHYFMNCPYYTFERNILINELNNIGVDFEFQTLLRGKSQNSYKINFEIVSIDHLLNPQRDFSSEYIHVLDLV